MGNLATTWGRGVVLRRGVARWVLAVGGAVVILIPATGRAAAPSLVTADVAVGARVKPVGGVTGECTACTSVVSNVPLSPFKVCAVATSLLLNGQSVTGRGPSCPDFV